MTDQIISRDTIRARRAFAAGHPRDSHDMNPGAAALVDWLGEYDRLVSERARDIALESRRAVRMAKAAPPSHGERAGGERVDAHQVTA